MPTARAIPSPGLRHRSDARGLRAEPRLIKSLGGHSGHERRVARIAVRLFDLLSPLHGLRPTHRRLLRLAALLHDAGRATHGADQHHVTGAEIVLDDRRLRLNDSRRRAVAYLVRYHCGPVPQVGRDEVLVRGDGRRRMQVLLALLRAADGLDSRRLPPPAIIARLHGRRLRIRCVFDTKLTRARRILRRKAKFDLLEQTLAVRVKLRIGRTPSADAVLA